VTANERDDPPVPPQQAPPPPGPEPELGGLPDDYWPASSGLAPVHTHAGWS